MAQDVENYLSGQPVTATRRTAWYLTRKFVRRHRWAVAAAGVTLLAVTVAAAGLTSGLIVANQKKAEAQRSFQFAEQTVRDFLTKVSEEQLFDELPLQSLRKDLLEQAATYYAGLPEPLRNTPDRRREMGVIHHGLGMTYVLQGERDLAQQAFESALQLRRGLFAQNPHDPDTRRELAITVGMLGRMAREAGDLAQAEKLLGEARPILEGLTKDNPSDLRAKSNLVKLYNHWELMLLRQGNVDEAANLLPLERDLCTQLRQANPDREEYQADFVIHCINAGDVHSRLGDMAASLAVTLEARAVVAAVLKEKPGKTVWLKRSATIENNLAQLWQEQGDYEAARKAFQSAVEIGRQAVSEDPLDPLRSDLADTLTNLADLQFDEDQGPLACSTLEEVRGMWEAQLAVDPSEPRAAYERIRVDRRLAAISAAEGTWDDVLTRLNTLAEQWRDYAQKSPVALRFPRVARERMLAGIDLARAQVKTEKPASALATLTEKQPAVLELLQAQPAGYEAHVTAGAWFAVQAEYFAAIGNPAEEIKALQQAVDHQRQAAKIRRPTRRAQAELKRLETRLEELLRAKK
jgi:serine/threonine-protein kinase